MTRKWDFFVQDIFDAIQHIKTFIGNMTFEDFLADEKTRSAVAFKVENIGEAAKNIPREVKTKYKQLPWSDMAKMMDKITHFYFGINYKTVWKVAKEDLTVIEPAIGKILSELKSSGASKKSISYLSL
jgi:uncharacterized protein with HEPN domain